MGLSCSLFYCLLPGPKQTRNLHLLNREHRPSGRERALWLSEGPAALGGQGSFPLRVAIDIEPHSPALSKLGGGLTWVHFRKPFCYLLQIMPMTD